MGFGTSLWHEALWVQGLGIVDGRIGTWKSVVGLENVMLDLDPLG